MKTKQYQKVVIIESWGEMAEIESDINDLLKKELKKGYEVVSINQYKDIRWIFLFKLIEKQIL